MKVFIKCIVSIFVFLYYAIALMMGLFFPTTMIIMLSFFSLIVQPFIWALNSGLNEDNKIENNFPLIDATDSLALNNLLGITILLWVPFYGTYIYFTEKRLLF